MSLLVDSYRIYEGNRGNIKMCFSCIYPATWEFKVHLSEGARTGYSCGQHLDTALCLVNLGKFVYEEDANANV